MVTLLFSALHCSPSQMDVGILYCRTGAGLEKYASERGVFTGEAKKDRECLIRTREGRKYVQDISVVETVPP